MYCGVQGLQDFGVENELECRAVLAVFCPNLRATSDSAETQRLMR
jgi:hypothetical protein